MRPREKQDDFERLGEVVRKAVYHAPEFCPECGGPVTTGTVFDQECWECTECGFRWMDNGA